MRRETLLDFFADWATLEDEFLIYDDGYRSRSWKYREVAEAARTFCERLAQAGLGRGDKVLLWAENRPEWVAALWGCLLHGVVAVPLDYRGSADLVSRVQRVANARLLLLGEETPEPPQGMGIPIWKLSDLAHVSRSPAPGADQSARVTKDDIAEVLFTSGATAEPKGVVITHRNVLANIVPVESEVRKYLGKYRLAAKIFFPIRFLNLLPLSHMFGQAMATFIPPMLAGVSVFMRGYSPEEIVRQIRSRKISVLVCVPKILDVLREHVIHLVPEAAQAPPLGMGAAKRWWTYRRAHRLFGMKFWAFVVGGAPLDPESEKFWRGLGFVVIQGYGLTETAPIVTLNHPFHVKAGTVGKPIAGVEVKISEEGEILVRGDNVTTGYLNAPEESAAAFADGWFRTGDIGSIDESGRLQVRGRLKEMIVTAEGLNVFPEDVERVLESIEGVRESAVIGVRQGSEERVHAVLLLRNGIAAEDVVKRANGKLEDHQKIRGFSVWPGDALPRTEGTGKLKRRQVRQWVVSGGLPGASSAGAGEVEAVLARFAPQREITEATTVEDLGLSSLERVELLMALEQRFGATVDEGEFTSACSVRDLYRMLRRTDAEPQATAPARAELFEFPAWNRGLVARTVRRVNLPAWILPLARVFSWVRTEGLENLDHLEPPVIFAANHQSHLDVPSIFAALPPRWRYRLAPAMSKEFFHAHFYPPAHSVRERVTNSLNYHLACLIFNAFPLPQREAGARQTIRYAGELTSEGWCVLIFPEGRITLDGSIQPFQPGVGMLASRLGVPVVPTRIAGLDRVLPKGSKFPRPGRVRVKFGAPLRLTGDDYAELARQVEAAVRQL